MGAVPVHCRVFGFLASLPLDFSSGPSCDKQKCLQTLPNVPWVQKSPPVENCCTNDFFLREDTSLLFLLNDLEDIKKHHMLEPLFGRQTWDSLKLSQAPSPHKGLSVNG